MRPDTGTRSRLAPSPEQLGIARAYGGALAAVAAATVGTFLIYDWIEPSISLLFFPAVVVPAMYGGYGPALVATLLSTISLAYFFVPPRQSFNIGIDDGVRLAAFVAVSFATAWLGSARRRAEEGQRQSLDELRSAIATLKKVSGWPVVVGADTGASVRRMLCHAGSVLQADMAVAVWETEDEPWRYVASSAAREREVIKHSPDRQNPVTADALDGATFLALRPFDESAVLVGADGALGEWHGIALPTRGLLPSHDGPVMSACFRTEHLTGRVFLFGIADASARAIPAAEVVTREVGNSLNEMYVAEQARDLAIREDRLRVARDLHDGVLQSLTGVRLELQSIADTALSGAAIHDRLLAIERALAIEQRELRLFIDDLRPAPAAMARPQSFAGRLAEMCSRLSAEWRTPVTMSIAPVDPTLPDSVDQSVRLMIHEAVVNALKHGHPSRVAVSVDSRHAGVIVSVTDDGRGFRQHGVFDHDTLARNRLGPASLRERIAALRGRLEIESTTRGSRVTFSIPVVEPHA